MQKASDCNSPIGVFDSGIGGLTVVKELMRQLPREKIVYFGDTARVPYGSKSKEAVIRFSRECMGVLLQYHVKMVVVACNTSSSHALASLKKSSKIPVIGVVHPGAQKAVAETRNHRIGIIATQSTIHSDSYAKAIHRLNPKLQVISQACPLFVPLAEEGWFHKDITARVAKEYLESLRRFKVDTLILGCTHYPLLKSMIQKSIGPNVLLVDSAKEVAQEAKRILVSEQKIQTSSKTPRHLFLVSDEPKHFRDQARRILKKGIENVQRSPYV